MDKEFILIVVAVFTVSHWPAPVAGGVPPSGAFSATRAGQTGRGDRVLIGKVRVDGAKAIPPNQVAFASGLRPGLVVQANTVSEAESRIRRFYWRKGHIRMSVGVFQGISSGALRMSDFTINIIEGPVYHVGPVQIVGIDPGRANVMRRTFPMKEGQVYNPDIIDKAIEQLNRSGRFHPLSRSDVEITVHELDRTVSLVFQLREE